MKKLNKEAWFPFLLTFGLVLASLRGIYNQNKQIGHNWDFSFTYLDFLSDRYNLYSSYTWSDFGLGSQLHLTIVHFIPNLVLSFVSSILGSILSVQVLLLMIIIFSIWGFNGLLKFLINKFNFIDVNNKYSNSLIFIFSLLYGFSPFLFNEIIGGSWYMWVSYAASPFFAKAVIQLVEEFNVKTLILMALSMVFVIASMQKFVLLEIMLFIMIFTHAWFLKKIKKYLIRYTIIHAWVILINLYWILPFTTVFSAFSNTVTSQQFNSSFAQVASSTQSVGRIMNLSGFLNRNMYWYSLPWVGQLGLVITTSILWGGVIWLAYKKQIGKVSLFFIFLLIGLSFIVKGGSEPWGRLTLKIFEMFPLMNLYRSPQHLMFIPAFLIPIILAFGAIIFKQKYFQKFSNNKFGFVILIFVLVWTSGWWINGDLGNKTLLEQDRDRVNFYTLPPELIDIYELSENEKDGNRILFLPTSFSPTFKETEYQSEGQGGQPEYLYLNNPTLTGEHTQVANLIEKAFCSDEQIDWGKLASWTSVKYVVLRKDIEPKFTACYQRWDLNHVKRKLDSDNQLELISEGKYADLYSFSTELRRPLISAVNDLSRIDKEASFSASLNNQNIYKDAELTDKLGNLQPILPLVDYKKISPVEYSVNVSNLSNNFVLVFNQNFSSNWKLAKETNGIDKLLLPIKSIDAKQFLINGYANAWLVNSETLCSYVSCENDRVTFEILYEPQKLFYWGLIFSSISLIVGLLILPKLNFNEK